MKTKLHLLAVMLAAFVAAAFLAAPPKAEAVDYGIQKTFWNNTTNALINTGTTNLDAAVDCSLFTEFALEVQPGLTNAATGTLDVRWTTSNDGTEYTLAPAAAPASGWFSISLTNMTADASWRTNIPVNSFRYWKISWITNNAGQHMTGAVIRAYAKPVRGAPY